MEGWMEWRELEVRAGPFQKLKKMVDKKWWRNLKGWEMPFGRFWWWC